MCVWMCACDVCGCVYVGGDISCYAVQPSPDDASHLCALLILLAPGAVRFLFPPLPDSMQNKMQV